MPDEFWESADCYRDQKFYTAFCMLVSACSDYAIGVKLKRQKCLNWACTSFYYSMVHAMRLICFVETGDFPTGHKELGAIFKGEQERVGTTWISANRRYFPEHVEPNRNFQFALTSLTERQRLGKILHNARTLRNDANYEELLISHEYNHASVTQSFHRLATNLKDASEEVLLQMIRVFKDFVIFSPRKAHWYAFLNWRSGGEGFYYLETSLKHRAATVSKILDWLDEMYRQPDSDSALAEEVHKNIVMSVFAMKNSLMNDFKTNIDRFEDLLKKRFGRQ